MANHFTLSRFSSDLDLERLERRSDDQVFDEFLERRFAATGGTPVCPHCNGTDVKKVKSREMLHCRACRRQFTPRLGTARYKSKLSLYKWDKAMANFALAAKGVSAIEMAHKLGVEYKTARRVMQTIRIGFLPEMSLEKFVSDVKAERQAPMRDGMQFDGAEIGGFIRPKNVKKTDKDHRRVPYRSTEKEFGVVVIEPGGRVRVGVFKHEGQAKNLIKGCAKKKTVAYSDFGSSWNDLRLHFALKRVNHSVEFANPEANTNVAESFWALVRKFEWGAYHHISGIHLLTYLAEAAWRRENKLVSDREKYEKCLTVLLKRIPKAPTFNRNVKRQLKKEGRKAEYFALREVAAAKARSLAFA